MGDVISQRRVMVRFKNRGINKEDVYHPKTLGLIFRPVTPSHFLAITSQGHAKLNPLLSHFWEKLANSIRHGDRDPGPSNLSPCLASQLQLRTGAHIQGSYFYLK